MSDDREELNVFLEEGTSNSRPPAFTPPPSETHLTVFWEGTSNTLTSPITTQIGQFYVEADAAVIDSEHPAASTRNAIIELSSRYLKVGFNGCGVTHGCTGTICACGLRGQAATVIEIVRTVLKEQQPGRRPLHVSVLGQSRGAIGAIFLAQQLAAAKDVATEDVALRMLLFDPVPGNLVCTARVERLVGCFLCGHLTTANHCNDLRKARHLKRVLSISPHEPLPDCAYHAPVLVQYPDHAVCEEDVSLGCHQGALFSGDLASELSHVRIATFLKECGTRFVSRSRADAYGKDGRWVNGILSKMESELKERGDGVQETSRIAHIHPSGQSVCCRTPKIIRRNVGDGSGDAGSRESQVAKGGGKVAGEGEPQPLPQGTPQQQQQQQARAFLNKHHQQLHALYLSHVRTISQGANADEGQRSCVFALRIER